MFRLSKRNWYWIAQIVGWFFYIVLLRLIAELTPALIKEETIWRNLLLYFLLGITTTHTLRYIIIRFEWMKLSFRHLVLRIIPSIITCSIFVQIVYSLLFNFIIETEVLKKEFQFGAILNWIFLFFLWAAIYFLYYFIENYRLQEIKNLKHKNTIQEIEMQLLRSQLNPHFLFNSLNSIRSLISEDKEIAQKATSDLANLLRESLQVTQHKTIPVEKEIEIVRNYLSIEKVRFEERLEINYSINKDTYCEHVPPFIIQTLVENSVKHGISGLINGGTIDLKIYKEATYLNIIITNPTKNNVNYNKNGIGINNTQKRLKIIYGDKAFFQLGKEDSTIIATLKIPL